MDKGRIIASGTKEELKQMIKTGETITIEAIILSSEQQDNLRTLPHVFDLQYKDEILTLNYLQEAQIPFGRVFSELPTLNDVFLEITGKQLRD